MEALVTFFSGEPLVIVCVLLTMALIYQTRRLSKLQDRMDTAADQTQQERIRLQELLNSIVKPAQTTKEGRNDEAS